ncbi:MAG TPA: hypothetical protein VEW28_09895 [Candidatus Kapabacteria bacterium]|nr:hypothetical protein [Candidatus Kapabacteria bacterium]
MKNILIAAVCSILLSATWNSTANAQTSAAGTVDTTFTPGGKFSAQFFGDVYYKMHADSLSRDNNGQYSGGSAAAPNVPNNSNNFQMRRVYLGYNYDISRSFSTEFLLAYEEGNAGSTLDNSGERSVYMKLANIRWKNIFSNADVIFGAQATPGFVSTSEANWGYRSIEKTLTDKNGIIKSSDLGIALRGAFDDGKNYGYDLMLADGTGQKLPTLFSATGDNSGRNKKLYVDLWGKFMDKKIVVQAYFDDQRTSDPADQSASTLKFYAAYATTPLTIGAELFMQTKTNAVKDSNFAAAKNEVVDQKPFGFSVFATAQLIENSLNIFARFDMFNPDNNFKTDGVKYTSADNALGFSNNTFIVGGLDWTPYKNVHIMPNLWYQGYSAKASGQSGKVSSDNDIVPRVTFYYKY